MSYEEKARPAQAHALTLTERERMELSGVEEVVRFDEEQITVATVKGELHIRGAGLKVDKLDKGSGQLWVSGQVDALIYAKTVEGGFWERVFR